MARSISISLKALLGCALALVIAHATAQTAQAMCIRNSTGYKLRIHFYQVTDTVLAVGLHAMDWGDTKGVMTWNKAPDVADQFTVKVFRKLEPFDRLVLTRQVDAKGHDNITVAGSDYKMTKWGEKEQKRGVKDPCK